jgi:hypothetical protein
VAFSNSVIAPVNPGIWGTSAVGVQRMRTDAHDNEVSTHATVRHLCRLARVYAGDPFVVAVTREALESLANDADRDKASAIFYWVRANIQFVEDEALMSRHFGIPDQELDKELIIVPPVLLNMSRPQGDCDDFSLLTASMALCAGLLPYYVTVCVDPAEPWRWSHIYVCVRLADENTHFSLDTGNRLNIPAGWEPQQFYRRGIWAI